MKRILHIIPSLVAGGAECQLANLVSHTTVEFSHFVCIFNDAGFFAPTICASGHEICVLLDVGCCLKPYEKFSRHTLRNTTERNTRLKAVFGKSSRGCRRH